MAATSIVPPVESPVEKKTLRTYEPKPVRPNPPAPKSLLYEIFEGHEDFLGWTPD